MLISRHIYTGATIGYNDEDVLDNNTSQLDIKKDILIDIGLIQEAADFLKNNTKFLAEYEPLGQQIALLDISVNGLIAGEGRTLADLFDLTDWARSLKGTPTQRFVFLYFYCLD